MASGVLAGRVKLTIPPEILILPSLASTERTWFKSASFNLERLLSHLY
jgi:hypothetical protein